MSEKIKNIRLDVYRPKIKNFFIGIGFFIIFLTLVFVFFLNLSTEPLTTLEKTLNCVVFAVSLIGAMFTFAFAANCVRNIFSPPFLTLTNEEFSVFKNERIKVSEITQTVLSKDKQKAEIHTKEGKIVRIKQKDISIPVGTLIFAIKLRTNNNK